MSGFWIGFVRQGLFLQSCECQGVVWELEGSGYQWGLEGSGCQFGVPSFQCVHKHHRVSYVHARLGGIVSEGGEGGLAKGVGSG